MHTAEPRAISATLGALTARLPPELGARVRESLPPPLATPFSAAPFEGAFDAAELYAHVGELEQVDPLTAATHAREACRVIAENLPAEVVVEMQAHLGPELAPLLVHDDERSGHSFDAPPTARERASFIGIMVGIAVVAFALAIGMALMIAQMR